MSMLVRVSVALLALACVHCGSEGGGDDGDKPAALCLEMIDSICDAYVSCSVSQGFTSSSKRNAETRDCVEYYRSESSCEDWDEDSITRRFDVCIEDLAVTSCYLDATEGTLRPAFKVPSSCSEYIGE